jgi:hypothetical protein
MKSDYIPFIVLSVLAIVAAFLTGALSAPIIPFVQ